MSDKGFNGSTLKFPSTSDSVGSIRSISYSNAAAAVDVSSLSTTTKAYVNGQTDPSVTLRIVGQTSLSVGATGSLTVTFNDSTTTTGIGTAVLNAVETSGDIDGAIESSLTFKPYGG